jgi:hypothetical protein
MYDTIYIEKHENFIKQSYRNRCIIYGANGKLSLSIPLKKGLDLKSKITEIEIDYTEDWQKNHFKSIESAYRHSPFYEYYIDEFEKFFTTKYNTLFELNSEILNTIFDILELESNVQFSDEFLSSHKDAFDFRNSINPKSRLNKHDNNFNPTKYIQVFGEKHGFIPNLSILDLIFNEGPNSYNYLFNCIKKGNQ